MDDGTVAGRMSTVALVHLIRGTRDRVVKARLLDRLIEIDRDLADRLYSPDWDEEDECFEPEWFPLPADLRGEDDEEEEGEADVGDATPPTLVLSADGLIRPAPGYAWASQDESDLMVRPVSEKPDGR